MGPLPLEAASITFTLEPSLAATLPIAIRGGSAIVIMLVAVIIAERARRGTIRSIGHTKADLSTAVFVGRIAHLGTLLAGVLIALGILGISWTALLAVFGAVSFAAGLAIQDILRNFVAGLYILMERPFRVGDTIKVKDFTGKVEDIGIRTTLLRTDDDLEVVIPNMVMFGDAVVNFSASKIQSAQADEEKEATSAEMNSIFKEQIG